MSNLSDKQELAISYYFHYYKWSEVAKIINVDQALIYQWNATPKFKKKLDERRAEIIQENNDALRSKTENVDRQLISLIAQNDDLTAKLNAIKEFNRKFEKYDDRKDVTQSIALLEEMKNSVKVNNPEEFEGSSKDSSEA